MSTRRFVTAGSAAVLVLGGSLFVGFGLNPATAAGTPYQLAFTPSVVPSVEGTGFPSPGAPLGSGGTVEVQVEDSSGTATGTSPVISVTLGIGTNAGDGTLTCTSGLTVSTNASGLATFTGCSINSEADGYTIEATSPGLKLANSNAFNVTGKPAALSFTSGPASVPVGNAQTINVSVEDSAGKIVTADSSTVVTIAVNTYPALGGISCVVNSVTDSGGVASFTGCTFTAPGTYTLKATANGLTPGTTNSFSVTSASQLAFNPEPSNGAAGSALPSFAVSVEDQYGNVVTSATGTVSLAIGSNPGSGTLGGTCSGTLASGTATFTACSISAAGNNYTLIASMGGFSSITSSPFDVSGSPSQLAFTPEPATVGVNQGQTIAVSVEDSSGNVDPVATNSVTLAIQNNSGGGILTCTNGLVNAAVAGVATFKGCAINAIGNNYTLNATATGLTTAISNGFNVQPANSTVLTLAATGITNTGATLNGQFNPGGVATSYDFEVSTNPDLAASNITVGPSTSSAAGLTEVSLLVSGLSPGQTYYYELFVGGLQGGVVPFTTGTGAVTTNPASSVTTTSAILNGTDSPDFVSRTCQFAYGTSSSLTNAAIVGAPSTAAVGSAVAELASVSNLTPATTYYFQLECSNGDGGILSFYTGTGAVLTQPASSITANGATLNGTVNPGGSAQTCSYYYGTSSNLAGAISTSSFVTLAASSAISEPVAVSNLTPATTYYFQLECSNGDGGILSFVAGQPSQIDQIYGTDPIGTSIAVSQAEFPTTGSASAVVLARDDFFSDALAGGPLAAYVNGPMLLTEGAPISSTLDPRTQAEIQRVLPLGGTVYILGGSLAISPNVDATLQSLGYNVVREAGTDEYDTALDIAQQMGNPSVIFEATGTNYYDALSAVPAAIEDHAAILLTDGNVQSYATGLYIIGHPGVVRYAIGGPLAAAGADPGATAVYGNDLYSTSAAVASTFFPGATMYGAATSATFTDALGGGVFMATGGRAGPLLIVNPNVPLPNEILPYLASLSSGTQGYVFGGPLAISPSVLSALQAATG